MRKKLSYEIIYVLESIGSYLIAMYYAHRCRNPSLARR